MAGAIFPVAGVLFQKFYQRDLKGKKFCFIFNRLSTSNSFVNRSNPSVFHSNPFVNLFQSLCQAFPIPVVYLSFTRITSVIICKIYFL